MAQPGRRQAGRVTVGAAAAAAEASPLSDAADEAGLATVPLLPATAPAVEATAKDEEDVAGEGYPVVGRPVVGDPGGGPVDGE